MKISKGFTLNELLIALVVFGILVALAIPRFMGAQDRARVGAAIAIVTTMREALGLYVVEWGTYRTNAGSPCTDYEAWKVSVVDFTGRPYITMPDTLNFDPASFNVTADVNTYEIQITARDKKKTTVHGAPEKIWQD